MQMSTKHTMACVTLSVVCLLAGPNPAVAQDLEAGLQEALNRALTMPLPRALDPFITLAQEADVIALATLEIGINVKEKEILDQQIDADRPTELRLRKRMRALQRVKSAVNRIKRERELAERKAEEDGWDPFYAVFEATGPLVIPGTNTLRLVDDGEEANQGFSAIVRPLWGGYGDPVANIRAASLTVELAASGTSGKVDVGLVDFDLALQSFEIAAGTPTGVNRVRIRDASSRGTGELDLTTGQFDFWFEGSITNDIHRSDRPILFFAHVAGILNQTTGEVTVFADDPMLVPLPAASAVSDQPAFSAAATLTYDADSEQLTLSDFTGRSGDPVISLVRYGDGAYTADSGSDVMIGAAVEIDPISLIAEEVGGRFSFDESRVTIRTGGTSLLQGTLEDPLLDGSTGTFYGTLRVDRIENNVSSRFLSDIRSSRALLFQIGTGPAVYDLVALTNRFTTSGTLPVSDFVHGTAGVLEEPGPALNTGILVLVIAAVVVLSVVVGLIVRRSRAP